MMKKLNRNLTGFIAILLLKLLTPIEVGSQDHTVFSRDFDSDNPKDQLIGYVTSAKGVSGQAVQFDGLTSYVVASPGDLEKLKGNFTIDAWVALQEYPWNWSGILDMYSNRKGLFFGINANGEPGLFLGTGKKEIRCVSEVPIEHLTWTHVAATFDASDGIRLYINGQEVAYTNFKNEFEAADELDVWIGRSHTDTYPEGTEREVCMQYKSKMILDGLLDELNVYDSAFPKIKIEELYRGINPDPMKPLEWRTLPKGPEIMPDRFAAYYTRLFYNDQWERLWRISDDADILVTFEDSPVRLFFWRGINYGPTWVTENDIFTSNQSMEYYTEESGCNEHMADKQCRYSHVRIIEKNDARVVVHWRYALTSVAYDFPEYDPVTNWGDWGDEYLTIYPDGVAVRKQILHSHRFEQTWRDDISDGQYTHYQFNETFVFSQPGHSPYEYIEDEGITLTSLDGEVQGYSIRKENPPNLKDALIKVVNTKSKNRMFAIFEPGTRVESWIEEDYFTWNHWPVAQLPSDGRFSTANDRPAHTALSSAAPVWASEGNRHTAVSLYGMNTMEMDELIRLGKSWNFSCKVISSNAQLISRGYDKYERAFVFENLNQDEFTDSEIRFHAEKDHPFHGNAVLIKNLPFGEYKVESGIGNQVIRTGHVQTMEGMNLVIWIGHHTDQPFNISITNAEY